jgi:hypothetical protein
MLLCFLAARYNLSFIPSSMREALTNKIPNALHLLCSQVLQVMMHLVSFHRYHICYAALKVMGRLDGYVVHTITT